MFGINILAVILIVITNVLIGTLWYSPILFGKKWAELTPKKPEQLQSPTIGYLVSICTALVSAVGINILANWVGAVNPVDGILVGLLASLFPICVNLNSTIFSNKPIQLYFIDNGYPLMISILSGILFAVWR